MDVRSIEDVAPVVEHNGAPVHCLCFAIGVAGSGPVDSTEH